MKALYDMLGFVAALFGIAFVMLAWSEFVFFNEGPVLKLVDVLDQGVLSMAGFILDFGVFYLIPSSCLIGLVGLFGSRGSARMLLIGALTGYSIEGAVVPAVYEAVPFSYLWTSIAWHSPITVALGVFVLPRCMAELSMIRLLSFSVMLGVFWAIWTTWIWADDAFSPISAIEFAQYSAATAGVMILGYGLMRWSRWPEGLAPRWLSYLLLAPTVVLFVLQGLAAPISAVGLLLILTLLVLALCRSGYEAADEIRTKASSLLSLIISPAIASLTYLYLLKVGPPLQPEDLVLLAFAAGMIVWFFGVVRNLRLR